MRFVTGLLVRKGRFYHAPPFGNLLLTNQMILKFKNRSVITMAHQKLHVEVRKFGTSLDGYDSLIDDDGEGNVKGEPNEE